MSTERARLHARPGHLRGAEERLRNLGRPDGRADPAHLLLVRHLRARLLVRAVRRERQHGHAGQPGHRRPRRHAALHGQGGASRRSRATSTRATSSPSTTPTSAARTSTTCASSGRSSTRARSSPSPSPTGTGPTSAAACPARSTSTPRSTSARACASRRCGSGTRASTCADVGAADRLQHARARRHARATCTPRPRRPRVVRARDPAAGRASTASTRS